MEGDLMSRVLLIGSPREKGTTAYLIGEFGRALVGKARAAIGIRRRPGRAPVHDDWNSTPTASRSQRTAKNDCKANIKGSTFRRKALPPQGTPR
jgi:hypothetical protein